MTTDSEKMQITAFCEEIEILRYKNSQLQLELDKVKAILKKERRISLALRDVKRDRDLLVIQLNKLRNSGVKNE